MKKRDRLFVEVVVGLLLITAAVYFFVGTGQESIWPAERIDLDSGMRLTMGTFCHVVAVANDEATAKGAINAAFEQLNKVEKLMSTHRADSEISRVNAMAAKKPVLVSEPTFRVMEKAVAFARLSDGAFDITVGPLIELWQQAELVGAVPAQDELKRVQAVVGYDKLLLDANDLTVRFAVDGMKLDVGGIAKGFAIDSAIVAMKKAGAIGGLVDVGGDMSCFGAPPKGAQKWRIGLQDSRRSAEGPVENGKLLLVLCLNDVAVATSGDYRRFIVIEGQIFSHIIDTQTGRADSEFSSATIICPAAVDADALATAVSVLGREKGLELVESLPDTEAILITAAPDYKLFKTSGAEQYVEK